MTIEKSLKLFTGFINKCLATDFNQTTYEGKCFLSLLSLTRRDIERWRMHVSAIVSRVV